MIVAFRVMTIKPQVFRACGIFLCGTRHLFYAERGTSFSVERDSIGLVVAVSGWSASPEGPEVKTGKHADCDIGVDRIHGRVWGERRKSLLVAISG